MRLDALDEAAEALGLEIGSPLTTARARVPELTVLEADPVADRRLLCNIGEACRRYTPSFSLDPPDGLNLDITGAARLFGGERKLVANLSDCMLTQGVTAHIGVARTLGLAWALCRYRDRATVKTVRDLPVAALRLDADSVGVLNRLGLRRVGQVLDMPRPALARRLGEGLLDRLDETLGRRDVSLNLVCEPLLFYVQHRLTEPICLDEQVLRLCRWLAEQLAKRLERRSVGGRVFALDLFRVDGAHRRLTVQAARPLRDPARITGLFIEKLGVLNEGLEADFGFDLLRLTAENVESIDLATGDFLDVADDGDFAALMDRLTVRLGPAAIRRLAPAHESLIPERATRSLSVTSKIADVWTDEAPSSYDGLPLRPSTLFPRPLPIEVIAGVPEDPPQQFIWRRFAHRVARAEGPERIAWEWWRAEEKELQKSQGAGAAPESEVADDGLLGAPEPEAKRLFRDYYRLEDDQGRRFWVFREGAYAAKAQPRWFLHGLFP